MKLVKNHLIYLIIITILMVPGFAIAQINIGGRFVESKQTNGRINYQFSWPATYFEQGYLGKCISFSFGENKSSYKIYLNGNYQKTILPIKNKAYSICSDVKKTNIIRIEKISETQGSINYFNGFKAISSKLIDTPKRSVSIEFIGDSLSVGYGNTSDTRKCNGAEVAKKTDSSLAYPILTAKAFNAEYQVNASSGFGIVRNYNNAEQGRSLVVLYQSTQIKEHVPYINNIWQPNLYLIGLGTNDFSTNIGVNEKWRNHEELKHDFVSTYVWFVKSLRNKNPNSAIVIISNGKNNPKIADAINDIEARIKIEDIKNTYRFNLPKLDFLACNYHPNLNEHKQISDELIAFINENKIINYDAH